MGTGRMTVPILKKEELNYGFNNSNEKKTKTKNQRAADKNHMERNKAAEGSFNMVSDHRSVWSDLLLSASWRLADGFSEL